MQIDATKLPNSVDALQTMLHLLKDIKHFADKHVADIPPKCPTGKALLTERW